MNEHIVPGGLGKFEYEITGNVLKIVLPVEYIFVSGNKTVSPGFGVDAYEWPSDDAKDEFKNAMSVQAKSVWENTFNLYGIGISKTDADRTLSLEIVIEERPLDPLWKIIVGHDPGDETTPAASVCEPGTRHLGSRCVPNPEDEVWGTLAISSALKEPVEMLPENGDEHWIYFKEESAEFAFEHLLPLELHEVISRLKSQSQWTIRLIGAASPNEIKQEKISDNDPHPAIVLARNRIRKVSDFLEHSGVSSDRISSTIRNPFIQGHLDDGAYVILMLSNDRQSTLAHEIGHLIGLSDEYAANDDEIGKPMHSADYIALIEEWGYIVPVLGPSRSIMSRGNTVFPRHFTPFLDLLRKVMPQYEWSLTSR